MASDDSKTPPVIVVEVSKTSPVEPPAVAKRLEDRSKAEVDAWDVAEKHRKAEERKLAGLPPQQVVEHNKHVTEVNIKAVLDQQVKRGRIEDSLKSRQENARHRRSCSLDSAREKASKACQKQQEIAYEVAVAEEKKRDDLLEEINKKQVAAAEKRFTKFKEIKKKAGETNQKLEEVKVRKLTKEEEEAARREEELAKSLEAAEARRAEQQRELVRKVSMERQKELDAQKRLEEEKAKQEEKAAETQAKLAKAEEKRRDHQLKVVEKAQQFLVRTESAKKSMEKDFLEAKEKIEEKLDAAEQRRKQALEETVQKAAAVGKKVEAIVATKKTTDEAGLLRTSSTCKERHISAEKRAEQAIAAKSSGLTEYMKVLNMPHRTSSSANDNSSSRNSEGQEVESPETEPKTGQETGQESTQDPSPPTVTV